MEERFGHDLSEVRVHTGRLAESSARAIGARAYTVGSDIVFGASEYKPNDKRSQKLLAHELAHVIQQRGSQALEPIAIQRQANPDVSSDDELMDEFVDDPEEDVGPSTEESSTDEDLGSVQMAPLQAAWTEGQNSALEREADAAAEAVFAHRSAHVTGRAVGLRTIAKKPKPKKPRVPQICGRNSTRVADWPQTFISEIQVDVTSPKQEVTLDWQGPNASAGPTGPFHGSPGAGMCGLDCDDTTTSQTEGSRCTPKDGSWPVESTGCALGDFPEAKNPVFFQRSGVALHFYPSVPNHPASHGCVRIEPLKASQVVHDNCIAKSMLNKGSKLVPTQVTVAGTWTRGTDPKTSKPVCWSK